MAAIVLIHGINNQRKDPMSMEHAWSLALQGGIRIALGKDHPLPSMGDVEVAFWGDLFRSRAVPMGRSIDRLEAKDLTEEGERELLSLLFQEALSIGEVAPPMTGPTMGSYPNWVQEAVRKLAGSTFFRSVYGDGPATERWLIYGLKAVHRYMNDAATYQAVQARVDESIADDTRLVIGHSLGSVIAYEALCRAPRRVKTLITLGSPLGVPTLIYDRLRPLDGWVSKDEPGSKRRMRPDVEHWCNVWDAGDLIALVKPLAPKFAGHMQDLKVSNGGDAHAIEKYFTDAAVGRAISAGWR